MQPLFTYLRTLHSSNFDTFSTDFHYAIHFIRAISKWAMSNHSFSTGWWQSCRAFEYTHKTEVRIIIVIVDFGYCCNAAPVYWRQNRISHRFIASLDLRSFSSSIQLSLHANHRKNEWWYCIIMCNLARVEQTALDNWSISWKFFRFYSWYFYYYWNLNKRVALNCSHCVWYVCVGIACDNEMHP